jgi:gliding motility-associated-like protein
VYVTCSSSATASSLELYFYDKATGARLSINPVNLGSNNATSTGISLRLSQTSISSCTTISVPAGCTITGASQPYQLQRFVGIVCLPASSEGFYAATAPSGARNAGINNLAGGGSASSNYPLGLYSTLTPPSIPNSAPVFTGNAVGLICAGDTTVVLNNAVDADGDRLVYSFGQPYSNLSSSTYFTPPGTYVPYTAGGGYSAATPLGTGAGYYAKLNASTGLTKYVGGTTLGNHYGIAVDVTEYRTINGIEVALGTTRRDIQLLVGLCPAVAPPVLPPAAVLPRTYTVEAGGTLSIPITGTQSGGHPLTLTATSPLLDGGSGYNATFAGNPGSPTYAGSPVGAYTVTGTTGGTVAGTFVFSPTCAQARATPYDIALVLQDVGCAGKLTSDVLSIKVVQATGPKTIAGLLNVCGLNTTQTYTASGGTAPTVRWTVVGGTIVGSATANPVTVRWPTAGAGTITAQGVSQYGCLVDQTTSNVTVNPAPTLTLAGAQTICQGSSTALTISGGVAPYTVTGGTTSLSGPGPFVLSPAQTTTYTVTGTTSNGCPATGQVTIVVNPPPVANAGAAVTLCPGSPAQLGAPAAAGLTYSWSPATGLSSSTVANPTVTLANSTSAPLTQTYTLTVTNAAGCASTATVAVSVNPLPVANAGAAASICPGGTAQLGAAPVSGFTYSWSPATGLSSSTVANPTVTLANSTSAPFTQTYTLTVTTAAGCQASGTVAVTVNPRPVANAGAAATICPGGTAQLGAAPVSGFTYSWSPATGLSSSTVANPTVTLANSTGAPLTQAYTLTVTTAAGCTNSATVAVTVSPPPVANAGAAASICPGGTAQLGAPPVSGFTYSWSPAVGLSSSSVANPTVTLANSTGAPLTQTYTLTVTTAAGCTNSATVAVTVSPPPVANAGAAASICPGGTAQLGSSPVSGFTYSWSPAVGLSNSTVANPTVTLANSTGAPLTQTYTLTVTTAAGCTNSATVAVTVAPAVTPGTIGASQTVCAGTVPALLTSTAAATGGVGATAYQWESSPDNATWGDLTGATGLAYAPGPVATTTYFRRRVAVGTCGTAYSNVLVITTQPLLVTAVALAVPPAQCPGTAFTFTPTSANAGTAPTYRWLVNGQAVSTAPTYTSSTLADGDQVRVELTPTAGLCTTGVAVATVRVSLTPVPAPTVAVQLQTPLPVCVGTPLAFSLGQTTNLGPTVQYQWLVDGVAVASATGTSFSSSTLRNGQAVQLVLRTTNACGQPATATSAPVRVIITQPVQISAGPDKIITEGEKVVLEGTADGTYPVVWSPAATLTMVAGNPLRPEAAPLVTTTYTLAAGAGYCGSSSSVTVTVLPRVRIPSAFSPNGDSADDTWQIDNIGQYANNRVVVFNRWGSKIFEAANYRPGNEWNGTINGQPAPVGTYYYIITLGNSKSFSGPITVVY